MKLVAKLKGYRWPALMVLGSCLYIGLLVAGMFSRDHGIRVSLQLRSECENMEREITQLTADNRSLRLEWDRLTGDLRYVEKLAREELNMVADREVVFLFQD